MDRESFLSLMENIIDIYESKNNNNDVTVTVSFFDDSEYVWNGEKFEISKATLGKGI